MPIQPSPDATACTSLPYIIYSFINKHRTVVVVINFFLLLYFFIYILLIVKNFRVKNPCQDPDFACTVLGKESPSTRAYRNAPKFITPTHGVMAARDSNCLAQAIAHVLCNEKKEKTFNCFSYSELTLYCLACQIWHV